MAHNESVADYEEHVKTFRSVLTLTRWGIFAVAMVVVALYCFVIAHQPFIGALLLIAIPVVAIYRLVTSYSQ
jgi:Bacterial aa3 type cytochrome c oxidase subunit IV